MPWPFLAFLNFSSKPLLAPLSSAQGASSHSELMLASFANSAPLHIRGDGVR
jgi:hypothetical protein